MKLTVKAETFGEWLALRLGWVPRPLVETHIAAILARCITAAVDTALFEALATEPLSARAIASRCGTEEKATALLLDVLVACRYVRENRHTFALTSMSRKWLLRGSRHSVADKLLLQQTEWRWLGHLEDFVRTGQPLDFHSTMSDGERRTYHRSMRALARVAGREVVRRIPLPKKPQLMLDLGGSHGHFAAALCRRVPGLCAEVLDLPDAIEAAAPLLAEERLGERVRHIAGDATKADLMKERYDLVLMSNLAHHLDERANRDLVQRIAAALKPGGVLVLQEPSTSNNASRGSQLRTLLGLYFALQSRPGVRTWTATEMAGWQVDAGLIPYAPVRLRTAPGWVQQTARRRIGH